MSNQTEPDYEARVELHDRIFQKHSVDHRIYCVPIDEEEGDRLEREDEVIYLQFGDKNFFPPIRNPRNVLDCGYGQGHWAVRMAQEYEDAEVTAVDIYPARLPEEPDNLAIEIWDLNHSLIPAYTPGSYDLIHSRFIAGGIKKNRWRSYVRELSRLLQRGGWLQMVEYHFIIQSDSGLLTDAHAIQQWQNAYKWYMEQEKDPRVGRRLSQLMRDAGLDSIQEYTYRLPIGSWPTDARQQYIGGKNLDNFSEMLESHAVWPFTQLAGWSREAVDSVVARARVELRDPRLKLYIPL